VGVAFLSSRFLDILATVLRGANRCENTSSLFALPAMTVELCELGERRNIHLNHLQFFLEIGLVKRPVLTEAGLLTADMVAAENRLSMGSSTTVFRKQLIRPDSIVFALYFVAGRMRRPKLNGEKWIANSLVVDQLRQRGGALSIIDMRDGLGTFCGQARQDLYSVCLGASTLRPAHAPQPMDQGIHRKDTCTAQDQRHQSRDI
jgi:hypothetical protein